MKSLKTVLDFYIKSSLHVAVCFVALLSVFHISYSRLWLDKYLLLSFCAVLIGYNFIKYGLLVKHGKPFEFKKPIIFISLLAIVTAAYLLVQESWQSLLIITVVCILSTLYVVPFYKGKSLRSVPIIKLLTVVVVWWLMIVIAPINSVFTRWFVITCLPTASDLSITADYYLDSIELTLFICALCIPFEIRDMKYDNKELKTLPQVIGVKNSKWLGIGLMLLAFMLSIFLYSYGYNIPVINKFIYLFTAIVIWFSDRVKSDYYASFFVEAIPVLWLLVYLWF